MMMTIEKRYLIELGDVLGVEFLCGNCKGRFLLGADAKQRMLWNCPLCNEDWLLPQTDEATAIHNLLNVLRTLDAKMQGRKFSMKLQITSSDEPAE